MSKMNGIAICQAKFLDEGDLIAYQLLTGVVSGLIVAVVDFGYQLTEDQKKYMLDHHLTIPEDPYDRLGGHGSRLVFGYFVHYGQRSEHFFIEDHVLVAVFSSKSINSTGRV